MYKHSLRCSARIEELKSTNLNKKNKGKKIEAELGSWCDTLLHSGVKNCYKYTKIAQPTGVHSRQCMSRSVRPFTVSENALEPHAWYTLVQFCKRMYVNIRLITGMCNNLV